MKCHPTPLVGFFWVQVSLKTMNRLRRKNIMITGASQGLGRELALAFAREGAAGLSLAARHGDAIRSVRDEVIKIALDANVLAIEADVSKPKDMERRQ
jgi:NAD(P)-dependent dehydrogenase (short-subunit alcohol dehydrogenase family)